MKKVLTLLLIFITFICSAQTRTEKAKISIRKYLKENLNDYKSYEPVYFSKIDSLFTSIEDYVPFNIDFKRVYDSVSKLKELGITTLSIDDNNETIDKIIGSVSDIILEIESNPDKYIRGATTKFKLQKIELEALKRYKSSLQESMSKFKPEFIGWKINHKFRSKNMYGGVVLKEYQFKFDKNLNVIEMEEVE